MRAQGRATGRAGSSTSMAALVLAAGEVVVAAAGVPEAGYGLGVAGATEMQTQALMITAIPAWSRTRGQRSSDSRQHLSGSPQRPNVNCSRHPAMWKSLATAQKMCRATKAWQLK